MSPGRWATLARYLRDPIATLDAEVRRQGAVARVDLGANPIWVVSDADLIHRVLVTDAALMHKGRSLEAARRLLGAGLLTAEDDAHRRSRRLIQPLFRSERLAAYARPMVEETLAVGARWRDGARVDLNRELGRLALAIVGRALFSTRVEARAAEIAELLDASGRVFWRHMFPAAETLWRLPVPATRRFERARARTDAHLHAMISERRRGPGGDDLLSRLTGVRDSEDPNGLADGEVRDEAITLLLAGHETTAQALTWTFALLAEHPAAERRLHGELDEVLGGRPPDHEDARRLRFTAAVVREALRLYPPVWGIARRPTVPYALDRVRVPAGTSIAAIQYLAHRDPAAFPDPDRFAPERWLGGGPPPLAYFPFGDGPRRCIGERFALLEATIVVAAVAQRWRIRPLVARPRPQALFTLRPRGGLAVRLEARRIAS